MAGDFSQFLMGDLQKGILRMADLVCWLTSWRWWFSSAMLVYLRAIDFYDGIMGFWWDYNRGTYRKIMENWDMPPLIDDEWWFIGAFTNKARKSMKIPEVNEGFQLGKIRQYDRDMFHCSLPAGYPFLGTVNLSRQDSDKHHGLTHRFQDWLINECWLEPRIPGMVWSLKVVKLSLELP